MKAPAIGDGAHYRLSIGSPSRGPVDCGSAERLNFEPKDWRLAMRDELRTAVRHLQSSGDEVLHASYASASRETVDAENVLFYNIGMGAFSASSQTGVRFERVYSTPTMPGSTGPWPHLARYTVSALREPFTHWQSGRVLARWQDASSPVLGEETKPGDVWLALKRSGFECLGRLMPPTANFGMRIRVRRGAHGPAGATSMLKALLDGVISALHVHDGANRDEIARRLARMLGAPAAEIDTYLMDASAAALGSRDLLWLRGANVQWNPADDGLVAAEVLVESNPGPAGRWSHTGELFEVREKSSR